MKRFTYSITALFLAAALLLLGRCTPETPEIPETEDVPEAVSEPEPEKTSVCIFVPPTLRPFPTGVQTLKAGEMRIYESRHFQENCTMLRRVYEMPDGRFVTMGRAESAGGTVILDAWTADSQPGTILYFDGTGTWTEAPLAEGVYQAGTMEIILESGDSFFLYLPKVYKDMGRATLEYLPSCDGILEISQSEGTWTFSLQATGPEDVYLCDYTLARTSVPLLPWIHENCPDTWMNYTQDGEGKWCFDGYYRTSPTTYVPTGENFIYCCPASYVVRSLAQAAEENSTAEALSLAMLETLTRNQTEDGCWLTEPESQWLSGDYQVGPGFYDTRFNTNLMEICAEVYPRLGGDFLLDAMDHYIDFYTSFAEAHHFETENGGWLVEDYWDPAGSEPLHTSLNHQLAECLTLYHLSDALGREDLRALAQRLLQAVEDTAPDWIMDNHDLHYRIQPDGTYCGKDYPYLTYNDLFDLQAYLTSNGEPPNEALNQLMQAKKLWMDANGVTGYRE